MLELEVRTMDQKESRGYTVDQIEQRGSQRNLIVISPMNARSPKCFNLSLVGMVMMTSRQRSILKIQKPREVLDYYKNCLSLDPVCKYR
jgi:hypothetical protein